MKNLLKYIIIACFLYTSAQAQSLHVHVVGAAHAQNEKATLYVTSGQPAASIAKNEKATFVVGYVPVLSLMDTETPTGLYAPEFLEKIKAFPNPVKGLLKLDVQTEKPLHFTVQVIDLQGKVVLPQKRLDLYRGTTYALDVTGLVSGIYQVVLTDEQGQLIKSFKIRKNY